MEDQRTLHKAIKQQVREFQQAGHEHIAIICLSAKECEEAYATLGQACGAKLITTTSTVAEQGVVIISSYLAKGMEYEAVIVYNASNAVYGDQSLRRTFYTVCTRAMHELKLFSIGERTRLIGK